MGCSGRSKRSRKLVPVSKFCIDTRKRNSVLPEINFTIINWNKEPRVHWNITWWSILTQLPRLGNVYQFTGLTNRLKLVAVDCADAAAVQRAHKKDYQLARWPPQDEILMYSTLAFTLDTCLVLSPIKVCNSLQIITSLDKSRKIYLIAVKGLISQGVYSGELV